MSTLNTNNSEKYILFMFFTIILFILITPLMGYLTYLTSTPSRNKRYEREKRKIESFQKREKLLQSPIKVENGYIKFYDRYCRLIFIKVDEIVAINDLGDNEISITTTGNGSIFGRFYVIGKSDKVLEIINTYNN